jgi:hypothetical protein
MTPSETPTILRQFNAEVSCGLKPVALERPVGRNRSTMTAIL